MQTIDDLKQAGLGGSANYFDNPSNLAVNNAFGYSSQGAADLIRLIRIDRFIYIYSGVPNKPYTYRHNLGIIPYVRMYKMADSTGVFPAAPIPNAEISETAIRSSSPYNITTTSLDIYLTVGEVEIVCFFYSNLLFPN